MFPKAKLDELRPIVAGTPEGSPARVLLAMIDEALATIEARDRRNLVDTVRRQGRTPAEAEALITAYEGGGKIEMETVKCWTCEGWGFVQEPGCMGSSNGRCPTCHGHQQAARFKMPVPV